MLFCRVETDRLDPRKCKWAARLLVGLSSFLLGIDAGYATVAGSNNKSLLSLGILVDKWLRYKLFLPLVYGENTHESQL